MGYATLEACVHDLERTGQLVRVDVPLDPYLEIAAVQRRAFVKKAPAMLFTRVKGSVFPMLANMYGTKARIEYIFRDTLPVLQRLFRVKADPKELLRTPLKCLKLLPALWHALPRRVRQGSVFDKHTDIRALPALVSWPKDAGPFITLPLVYTEHPDKPGFAASNLGMYRVQMGGGEYIAGQEVGVHYQLHRGMGGHHAAALRRGEALPVHIFVGGPPAMTVAAVMPLPEGISELHFAGVLGGMRMPMLCPEDGDLPLLAHADFCISGYILPICKPEGPFGDHVGYYSLAHDFPVLQVTAVHHRQGAIWPFTTVGRPPQEDTLFGEFIHELTGPLVPQVFHGVHEVHAVDAAGVHPLLLAIGSERYVPYAQQRTPQELITCGFSVLGTTQTALAKYVLMAAKEDNPQLHTHDTHNFFQHMLERTDFRRDLHFMTRTTTDTLDYTGTGLNAGSKLLWVAAGEKRRELGRELSGDSTLLADLCDMRVVAPGIVAVQGPKHTKERGQQDASMEIFAQALGHISALHTFPLVVVVDDAAFVARHWDNFLWVVFTRSDPATDIYGVGAFTCCKHWGCTGSLMIDARCKAFHAPVLEEDPDVTRRIEALAVRGKPLYGYI